MKEEIKFLKKFAEFAMIAIGFTVIMNIAGFAVGMFS